MSGVRKKCIFAEKVETMNEENLIHGANATSFSGRDAADRARAREAGAKGIEAKKRKKLLRESIMEAADMVAMLTDAERQAIIEQGGDPNDATNRAMFVAALWHMARQKSKDGNADRRLIMDASGEMVSKLEMQMTPKEYLASVREMRERDNTARDNE